MSWMASIGAAILMFFGSVFGTSHPSQNAPMFQSGSNTQEQQQQVSGNGSSQGSATAQQLMQEIGCGNNPSACAGICGNEGYPPACMQLRNLMSSGGGYQDNQSGGGSSNNSGQNYGTGQGNSSSGSVAFVGNNTPTSAAALPACPSSNAVFNHLPLNSSDFFGIEPMGHMNGEHILPNQADHVYLDALPSESSAEVYAPGNATLLAVAESTGIAGADKGSDTVKLYFSPCRSLMFALQINTLSPQIQNALSGMKPMNTQAGATVQNTVYGNLDIKLTSGEALGMTINLGAGAGADFAAADVRTSPLQFIDQNEPTGMIADSYLHAVCPLDYFTSSLRSTLYSLLTMKNAGANGIPACGSVMQDKAGTAQGNWYDKNLPAPQYQGINESSLLAIAHYNLNPAQGIVSVGTALIPSSYLGTQLIFTPAHSGYINREPSEITSDGQVYCFEGPAGSGGSGPESHIDIELTNATTLKADYGQGACDQNPSLSGDVVTYQR